ncbi:hypothetical protein PGT21_023117 [Puccinia graminis f. sp. tritici]|uniref:Uncharacterized protein n=1 Tax=Puccinia graminis f. sp. tritici TaxID=56615 RepID=A0A5B0RE64_PUCGR|nr:hypothetical protein PGT21_023117 [Puccinia graminis f. sp. tritici]KAA1124040.1 hypothetical protein PGTUg99_023285 [Puccinia graminis f. sp. tritici]
MESVESSDQDTVNWLLATMKRMRCVHRYRIASGVYCIASQGAMRVPASHCPHRHN